MYATSLLHICSQCIYANIECNSELVLARHKYSVYKFERFPPGLKTETVYAIFSFLSSRWVWTMV